MSDKQVRDVVKWFAKQMEERLKANDHKGDWEECSFEYLATKLFEEVGEVAEVILEHGAHGPGKEKLIKEAADVANIAMMIADNARKY